MYGTGWVKDIPDSRDFQAKTLLFRAVPTPKSYVVDATPLIYNQGNTPSCVGFSVAQAKTGEEYIQRKQRIWFDGSWLYKQCKLVDGIPNADGTYPRIALKILQEQGMKRIGMCQKPSLDYKISAYYRIDNTFLIDEVKQIIFQYGSILTASVWGDNWFDLPDTNIFPVPAITANSGGHAYIIDGWDDVIQCFHMVNSWGSSGWGNKGTAWMPYEIFISVPLAGGDVWKLIDSI